MKDIDLRYAEIPDRVGMVVDRRNKVLLAVAKGWRNAEMAKIYHYSVATVKRDVRYLMRRYNARNRANLVHIAHCLGLLKNE